MRNNAKLYIRNIFGPDFVVMHEMFSRDDYGIKSIKFNHIQPVIIDVGANIGAFSVLAGVLYRGGAKIFAYEPEEQNFTILCKNIDLNSMHNIHPLQQAVATVAEEQEFFISPYNYSHSLSRQHLKQIVDSKKINCTTITNILEDNNLEYIDFLKMDIEGFEYEVLFSLPESTYRKIFNIAIEIHNRSDYNKEQLVSFLRYNKFKITQSITNENVYLAKKQIT
jgi:FkbM family methyltransferase